MQKKAGGAWFVTAANDDVPVVPTPKFGPSVAANQFKNGNVRPRLEWKDGAFVLRGTTTKWEAAPVAGAP